VFVLVGDGRGHSRTGGSRVGKRAHARQRLYLAGSTSCGVHLPPSSRPASAAMRGRNACSAAVPNSATARPTVSGGLSCPGLVLASTRSACRRRATRSALAPAMVRRGMNHPASATNTSSVSAGDSQQDRGEDCAPPPRTQVPAPFQPDADVPQRLTGQGLNAGLPGTQFGVQVAVKRSFQRVPERGARAETLDPAGRPDGKLPAYRHHRQRRLRRRPWPTPQVRDLTRLDDLHTTTVHAARHPGRGRPRAALRS
jgi:hypothetical protein